MNAEEMRKLGTSELNEELISLRKELFNLRVQQSTGHSPKTHLFKRAKKDIARAKTLLGERGRNNAG